MSKKIISLYRNKLAREEGTVIKDWGGKLTVGLVYPSTYHIGMSNLGFQIVYGLFNKNPAVVAERFFIPDGMEMSIYLQSGKPLLSLETQRPLDDFDLVAFSLSFENDFPNILQILDLGKIPLTSEERGNRYPLIMAGGITTFMNPEPLSSFMDLFLLGEAETCMEEFLASMLTFRTVHLSKKETLLHLARNIPGVYVPSFYRVAYRKDGTIKSFTPDIHGIPEKVRVASSAEAGFSGGGKPVSSIITPETEFGDKVLIELGRGCGHSCRFCAAGYVYRPPRVYDDSKLRTCIQESIDKGKQLGLLSAAVSDVPGINDLMTMIVNAGCRFSVSSLRAESLTRELLVNLRETGQHTVTIAPEAGTERLRKTINKHLTENQITDSVRLISGTDDFSLRLYFLVGLPTETQEDMEGIVHLVKGMKHHMVKESASRGTIGQIRMSINCFVPKPFTPFQWFPMDPLKSLKEKQKWLKKAFAKVGGVKVNSDVPKWAYVQTLLSMGDRRVGAILLQTHRFDGNWSKAFRSSEVNPDFFVYRPRDLTEILPWDFVDHGISKQHLKKEYALALEAKESEECNVGECFRCGVCGSMP